MMWIKHTKSVIILRLSWNKLYNQIEAYDAKFPYETLTGSKLVPVPAANNSAAIQLLKIMGLMQTSAVALLVFLAMVYCATPSMNVSTTFIQHAENVTVTWSGISEASADDFVAMFAPPEQVCRSRDWLVSCY